MTIYKVEEVSTREEMDSIADCIWTVMAHCDSAHKVFYPILHDRESALSECRQSLWSEHTDDASSNWVFVRDVSSQALKVVGACQWRIYERNPFPHGFPPMEATWWPEGEGREFATEFIRQCLSPRVAWMSRPHAGLSWCVVLPEYQKRGIGQALMAWGLTQTDQLGLESYIEATPVGRKLYERCGYRMIARVDIDIKDDDRGEEWKRIRSQTLPSSFNCMWRPGNGLWAEEPQKTWTERLTLYEDAKPKS